MDMDKFYDDLHHLMYDAMYTHRFGDTGEAVEEFRPLVERYANDRATEAIRLENAALYRKRSETNKAIDREKAAELLRFAESIAARMAQPDLGVDSDYTPTVASVLDELRARAAELSA